MARQFAIVFLRQWLPDWLEKPIGKSTLTGEQTFGTGQRGSPSIIGESSLELRALNFATRGFREFARFQRNDDIWRNPQSRGDFGANTSRHNSFVVTRFGDEKDGEPFGRACGIGP